MVAVGTAVARRPPHGSRRAALPHRALAADQTPRDGSPSRAWPGGSLGRSSRRASPSLLGTGSDRPVLPPRRSRWPGPFPPPAPPTDSRRPLFAGFAGTTGLSDFPPPCIAVVSRRGFTARTCEHTGRERDLPASGRRLVSPFARCLRACMGSSTPRDPDRSRMTSDLVLPSASVESLGFPENTISGLNGQPARTPVNASRASSRMLPHDSEPVWLAMPSPYGTFIHNTSPAWPALQPIGAKFGGKCCNDRDYPASADGQEAPRAKARSLEEEFERGCPS